jgi:hypothetical protein
MGFYNSRLSSKTNNSARKESEGPDKLSMPLMHNMKPLGGQLSKALGEIICSQKNNAPHKSNP